MPGLGRQPQAPSSAVPAALPAAAPGVRSEPRPAPAPAPRPPPSGGSVKPGGEGGGGGSPTRAGAGGGGGPAGGELAAKTFPMVACKGERSEGEGQGPRAPVPVPAKPRSAPGPGSHWRQRLHPAWAPLPPRAPRATEPAAAAAATVAPPRLTHWFGTLWDPPTSFKAWPCNWSHGWESHPTSLGRPFLLAPTHRPVEAHFSAFPIGPQRPHLLARNAAGSSVRPPLVCAAHFETPTDSSPPPLSRGRPFFRLRPAAKLPL